MYNEPLKIFVGYDPAEAIAYHVCCNSILEHATRPVSFTPIGLMNMPKEYDRPRGEKDSTEFAIARFLTPWFCNYKGYALFMDCDMVLRGDISRLFDEADPSAAISVVKHDYVPKSQRKFLNQEQTQYPKKNWSSVILFNNKECEALTMDYVLQAHGLDLHQFKWIEDDQIGSLSPTWNHLVGEYPASDTALNLHYTLGGPYFEEYRKTDNASDWLEAFGRALEPMSPKL